MKIIVGLGNPGSLYVGTRHNCGIALVDLLATRMPSSYGWRKHYSALVYKSSAFVLVKPKDVFMNESGKLLQGLPDGEVYIVHDDLDIRLGDYKIQKGIGPRLHYGVQSIENQLGAKDFWRVRIGVDNREAGNRISGEEYVLQRFSPKEREVIEGVLNKAADEIYPPNS